MIMRTLEIIMQREKEIHIDNYHVNKSPQRSLKKTARDFPLCNSTCDVL